MTHKRKIRILIIEAIVAMALALLLLAMLLVQEKEEHVPADSQIPEASGEKSFGKENSGEKELGEMGDDKGDALEEDPGQTQSDLKEAPGEYSALSWGIDVSEHQEIIDWQQVASAGVDFAMVRVGYRRSVSGEMVEDRCARYNLQEASALGIPVGAYFFSTAINEEEAREEARWVLDLLAGYPITYPVVYNCEGFQNESSRQHNLTIEERSGLARIFLDQVEQEGYTGMFYAARSELAGNFLWDTEGLEREYRIWVAQYVDPENVEVDRPDYDGAYVMWQYTDKGTIPGIRTVVDLNRAYIGYSRLGQPKGQPAAPVDPNPEVGVTFEEVEEQVTAKEMVNLRSTMDQSEEGNIVAKLRNGETALRTGKGSNGWSRLEYDGQIVYAVSSFLTEDTSYRTPQREPESEFKTQFTRVSELVTAKEVTNLRNRPSVEDPSQVIVQLYHGEVITRTGVSDVGWSRVEYNGQTLYCISSYLEAAE